MGQARIRGTQEQRAAEAVARDEADKAARQRMKEANERQRRAAEAALPPEVRQRVQQRRRVSNLRMMNLAGMIAALGVAVPFTTDDEP